MKRTGQCLAQCRLVIIIIEEIFFLSAAASKSIDDDLSFGYVTTATTIDRSVGYVLSLIKAADQWWWSTWDYVLTMLHARYYIVIILINNIGCLVKEERR